MRRSAILLTGFGPYPGVAENASADLARKLAHLAARRFPGHRVVARVLPTEWQTAPARLASIYARERPRVALHFGVSSRAEGFVIETLARNVRADCEDAAGVKPDAACVVANGPECLPARLPAAEIVARLRAMGYPAALSDDAGSFLCNAVLFNALFRSSGRRGPSVIGFVHIPATLSHRVPGASNGAAAAGGEPCPLDWEVALAGGLEIVRACLGRPAAAARRRSGAGPNLKYDDDPR